MSAAVSAAQAASPGGGPVEQALRIGLRALRVVTLLLAAGWLSANVRPVPPDKQAVVMRFGRVVRVQQAGLVLALPRPVERVVLLPGPDQQLRFRVAVGTAQHLSGIEDVASLASAEVIPTTTGAYLTGDGGVVLLDTVLTYRVSDVAAYVVAEAHVAPALRRLFMAATVEVAARRGLDDFMAVRDRSGAGDGGPQAQREAVRGELVREVNRRLRDLAARGDGLGVEVTRADMTAFLPPAAKPAFDAVLEAAQRADQGAAAARTDAARTAQGADRDRDRVLAEVHAATAERVAEARAGIAPVVALEGQMTAQARPGLLDQAYRERVASILRAAGSVTAVDGSGGTQVILPGALPAGTRP